MRPVNLLVISSSSSLALSRAFSQTPCLRSLFSRVSHRREQRSRFKTLASSRGSTDPGTMSRDVVIRDRESLERTVAAIRSAGESKLQVIADFDGTLTKYWNDGARGQTSHGLLQQGNEEYDAKRQALYDYYHPLEYSPTIPIEEKTKLMEEWYGS